MRACAVEVFARRVGSCIQKTSAPGTALKKPERSEVREPLQGGRRLHLGDAHRAPAGGLSG
eukprot:7682816-Alexandrium_andersonii.AAC.1